MVKAAKAYSDPLLNRLIELFNEYGPAELKHKYRQGPPLITPRTQMPIVFLYRSGSESSQVTNIQDEHIRTVRAHLVYDQVKELDQGTTSIQSFNKVYELMEELDDNFNLVGGLAYVVRSRFNLGNNTYIDLGESTAATFDLVNNQNGIITAESRLEFNVKTVKDGFIS